MRSMLSLSDFSVQSKVQVGDLATQLERWFQQLRLDNYIEVVMWAERLGSGWSAPHEYAAPAFTSLSPQARELSGYDDVVNTIEIGGFFRVELLFIPEELSPELLSVILFPSENYPEACFATAVATALFAQTWDQVVHGWLSFEGGGVDDCRAEHILERAVTVGGTTLRERSLRFMSACDAPRWDPFFARHDPRNKLKP